MIQVNTILLIRGSHFGKTLGLFFEGDSVLTMGNFLNTATENGTILGTKKTWGARI